MQWEELILKEMDLEMQLCSIKRYVEDELYERGPFLKRTDMPIEKIDEEIRWIKEIIEGLRTNPAEAITTARIIRKLEGLRKDFELAKEITLGLKAEEEKET